MELEEEDEEEVEEGSPAWMATYSDMATLLLTFFVLLLSFANMDARQFREVLGSVRQAFGMQNQTVGEYQARASTIVTIEPGGSQVRPTVRQDRAAMREQRAPAEMRRRIRELGLEGRVDAHVEMRGIVLRLREGLLFESGSDVMLTGGISVLEQLSVLVREAPNEIAVEGHTDDRPIHNSRFPSNWELSAARATAVLRRLAAGGVQVDRMQIAGYADTKPIGDNALEEGRAANRRVEIVFLAESRNPSTPAVPEAGERRR